MNEEKNKATVRKMLAAHAVRDFETFGAELAEDAVWRYMVEDPALTGIKTWPQMLAVWKASTADVTLNGWNLTTNSIIAEGDLVAAEVVSHSKLRNGRDFCNRVVFYFVFRGDKIVEVREYVDSQHIAEAIRGH